MEELFLIKNGERVRLDIGKGGLTIEVQNPLTVSLEEIALSRSWSFTLPDTAANRAAFDFAGVTPRAIRDGAAEKYAAEYYADGVPLLPDAVLYLDNIKAGAFVCQMVDNSQAGLARIKDENRSVREFVGDEMAMARTKWPLNAGFRNDQTQNSVLYDAGVPCIGGVNSRNEIYARITHRSEDDPVFYYTAPLPAIPVRWLLTRIFDAYGLTLGAGSLVYGVPQQTTPTDDVWSWGVVPLTNTEITPEQGRARCYQYRVNAPQYGQLFAGLGASANDTDMGASLLAVKIDVTIPATSLDSEKTLDIYNGGKKIASIAPQYMVENGGAVGWHFSEVVELGYVGGLGTEFSFRYGGSSSYIDLQLWATSSTIMFYRYTPNGQTRDGQRVSLATTLPDIGAWDLIKFLCVQSGSVPYVENGVFKVRKFADMGADVFDVSEKFNELTTHDITRAAQGVAQKNYYLMATEKLDEPTPQYKQRHVCIEAEDTTLEPSKETFKAAFASEYISQDDGGEVFTGDTIRAYTAGKGGVVEPQVSEPFVGIVCRMPAKEVERFGVGNTLQNNSYWMKCAAIEQDAAWVSVVENYVAKSAGVYKVRLRLSAVDVVKYDPLAAVYIAPLSLVGVVSSIRYTAGREYAEVTILKKYQ